MKTLFISDLDGTLLDSKGKVSENTAVIMNSLIKKGLYFTFATARSVYSAKPITENININVPCILMNGVSVYDLEKGSYVRNEYISESASKDVIKAFERHNVQCFMYKIHDDILTAYFNKMTDEAMKKFAEERRNSYRKQFVHSPVFPLDGDVVYFTAAGELEKLLPVKNNVAGIKGVNYAFYEDVYTKKYYLEVFSGSASKANGIRYLKKNLGFEKVVCFGDNLNDLTMFEVSDVRVAVENAKDEVKKAAGFTADSNDNDGVAVWINQFANNCFPFDY